MPAGPIDLEMPKVCHTLQGKAFPICAVVRETPRLMPRQFPRICDANGIECILGLGFP